MLIGLAGPAGVGKSTVAGFLTLSHGFRRHRFAGPLKDMMRALGLSDAQIDGDEKEVPTDLLCGKTPRHAMQTLGTEWGRELIGSDLWLNLAERRIAAELERGHDVVLDDVRFPNEAGLIRFLGGSVVRIEGKPPATFKAAQHASEAFSFTPDHFLMNFGGIDDLERTTRGLLDMLKEQPDEAP